MDKTREELVKKVAAFDVKKEELGAKHFAMLSSDPAKDDCWDQFAKAFEAHRQAQHELEMFDLRAKAKARLMVRLFEQAYDGSACDPNYMMRLARTDAGLALDTMTDDEVLAVEW